MHWEKLTDALPLLEAFDGFSSATSTRHHQMQHSCYLAETKYAVLLSLQKYPLKAGNHVNFILIPCNAFIFITLLPIKLQLTSKQTNLEFFNFHICKGICVVAKLFKEPCPYLGLYRGREQGIFWVIPAAFIAAFSSCHLPLSENLTWGHKATDYQARDGLASTAAK